MDRNGTTYDVTLTDGTQTEVRASGYVQEGPLTTFFTSARRRSTIDSLCERVASFRTADIRRIVRRDTQPWRSLAGSEIGEDEPAFEATAG
jgi:hypothetical protein